MVNAPQDDNSVMTEVEMVDSGRVESWKVSLKEWEVGKVEVEGETQLGRNRERGER